MLNVSVTWQLGSICSQLYCADEEEEHRLYCEDGAFETTQSVKQIKQSQMKLCLDHEGHPYVSSYPSRLFISSHPLLSAWNGRALEAGWGWLLQVSRKVLLVVFRDGSGWNKWNNSTDFSCVLCCSLN